MRWQKFALSQSASVTDFRQKRGTSKASAHGNTNVILSTPSMAASARGVPLTVHLNEFRSSNIIQVIGFTHTLSFEFVDNFDSDFLGTKIGINF